jgi:hypothetical protein
MDETDFKIDFDKLREDQERAATERCGRTELLVGECGCEDHRGKRALGSTRHAHQAPGTLAQFGGTCPVCDQDIVPGMDHITRDPGSDAWVHVDCA